MFKKIEIQNQTTGGGNLTQFEEKNKLKLLTSILNQSLHLEMYNITYEISRMFINDFIKQGYLPVFDPLLHHLK